MKVPETHNQALGNPRSVPLCYCGPYTVHNLQSSMKISEMVYTVIDNEPSFGVACTLVLNTNSHKRRFFGYSV